MQFPKGQSTVVDSTWNDVAKYTRCECDQVNCSTLHGGARLQCELNQGR